MILLNSLIKDILSGQNPQKESKISLIESVYSSFSLQQLGEAELHNSLIEIIEKDPGIKNKKRACKIFGAKVIVPHIKSKKYRKTLNAFLDKLRLS